jgi:hypothetical protein
MINPKDLNLEADALQQLVRLYQLQAIVARLIENFELINAYPNAQLITVYGGSLYQLAVQYYGDALKWTAIADANHLLDPELVGEHHLLIPPVSNVIDTGGVLSAQ